MSVCIYDPPSAANYVVIYGTATVDDATTGDEEVCG